MTARGSAARTKTEFSEELANMGAYYEGKSEREHTSFSIQTMKGDTGKALNLLGDAICAPLR